MPMMDESTSRPTVSVALCTHQGAIFVAEQVHSILRQTHRVDEIVISDDASTDETIAVIEGTVAVWARSADDVPSLVMLRNSTAVGVTRNFEQAIAACSSTFIALCDQDDRWREDKIERMLSRFEESSSLLLLGTDARMIDADGATFGGGLFATIAITDIEREKVQSGHAFQVLVRRNVVTGATAVLRRELADMARPFPGSWVHDEWLAIVAAASSPGGVNLLSEQLIDYRQHEGNQIGATTMTGATRLSRLRSSRTERNARLLARASVLAERIHGLTSDPARVDLALQKARHEKARSAYPAVRLARIVPVLREWSTGRYSTCGLGAQDVLRDLVQPV